MTLRFLMCAIVIGAVSTSAMAAEAGRDWRLPYEAKFWNYAGLNLGETEYNPSCQYTTSACDRYASAEKIYLGGRFNRFLGLEVSYADLGGIETAGGGTGGGRTSAHALGLDLTATARVGGVSLTAKLGEAFARTDAAGSAPGLITAHRDRWEPSEGLDASIPIASGWALRMDADRYRMDFSDGERGRVYTYTAGLEYAF